MPELSVVFGTHNRYVRLLECIESIRKFVDRSYEIVVADGGSTDGSREWLVKQPDVLFIGERSLNGAVDAYNKAFSIASGKYVAHINDDCRVQDNCFSAACDLLNKNGRFGQVAIPFVDSDGPSQVNYIHMKHTDILYANFGVVRRELGERVGWWGNYLHTYGGDCECSFRIWEAGFKVVPLQGYAIHHYREQDALRRENRDSRAFFRTWANRVSEKWVV